MGNREGGTLLQNGVPRGSRAAEIDGGGYKLPTFD